MKIVLDTNVLVSGLLNPLGAPGQIVRMVSSGTIHLCCDARILSEYRQVLGREKFAFDAEGVSSLLQEIEANACWASPRPLPAPLPDLEDEPFLEAALTGEARCLITGNLKHYPSRLREGAVILSPSEFLEIFRRELARPR